MESVNAMLEETQESMHGLENLIQQKEEQVEGLGQELRKGKTKYKEIKERVAQLSRTQGVSPGKVRKLDEARMILKK